jgi:hypothetical protein
MKSMQNPKYMVATRILFEVPVFDPGVGVVDYGTFGVYIIFLVIQPRSGRRDSFFVWNT